jgi:DNA-binding response OmpR family regulator
MRILILDDEPSILTMPARMCTTEGHEVTPFTNFAEALLHLATAPIDLLMTDLHMPRPDGVTETSRRRSAALKRNSV